MTNIEPYHNPVRNLWSEERQNILIELHAQGLSASMIGTRMGATRNSIIGKLHRMGKRIEGFKDLWTDPETDCLKSGWAMGINVKEIVASLFKQCGSVKSMAAVMSKADRLGLTHRLVNKARIKRQSYYPPEYKPSVLTNHEFRPVAGPQKVVEPINIPFIRLDATHCREVTGRGFDGLALYCGHPIHDRSFCAMHFRVNYYKLSSSQRTY